MPGDDRIDIPTTLSIKPKPASLVAAGSLAVLAALALWGFELRSISRLLLHSGLLSIGLWLVLYYFFFRKLHASIHIDRSVLAMAAITSIFFAFLATPSQITPPRYTLAIVLTAVMMLLFYGSFVMAVLPNEKIRWDRFMKITAVVGGLVGMRILLLNSFSSRIYADDFCYAVQLQEMGFWRSSLWFYLNWSGRFFSNFLVMGLSPYHQAQLFFLIAMLITFYLSLYALIRKSQTDAHLTALAGAFFIALTAFTVTPDVYKSLYWNGSAMVLLPLLVMIPIYLLVMAQLLLGIWRSSWGLLAVVLLLGFAITTTHESAALGWVGMHVIGLGWFFLSGSKNTALKRFLLAGLLAAVIGLAVLLLSPGVAIRAVEQRYPSPPPMPAVILKTIEDFLYFITHISSPYYPYQEEIRSGWLLIAAAAGLGWLMDAPLRRRAGSAAWVLASSTAMAAVAFFPGAYIYSGRIPERTQLIPSYYLVLGVFICGMLMPRITYTLLKKALIILVIMLMVFGSVSSISQLKLTVEPMRRYARNWDARDQTARSSSRLPQRIDVPWDEFEQELDCIQLYYQTFK